MSATAVHSKGSWLIAAAISIALGAGLGSARASVPVAALAAVLIVGVAAYAVSTETIVAVLIVTCPLGLEQVTNNQRNILSSFGGFAVSSARLGIILGVAALLVMTRGLPRRLVWQERVYLLLPAFLVCTLAFSPDLFGGLRFTAKVLALPAAWIACGWLVRNRGERFVWGLLMAALALLLLSGYALLAVGLGYKTITGSPPRFAGIVGAAPAAAYCTGVLGLAALYRWLAAKERRALLLYAAAVVPLFLTLTRNGIAGFSVASVGLVVLMGRARYALVISAVLIAAVASYSPLRARMLSGGTSANWQTIIATVGAGDFQEVNTEGRLVLWAPLAAKFQQSPLIGSGVGASEAVLKTVTHDVTDQAHSDYLALAVNGGAVALVLWLLALGGLMIRFARIRGPAAPAAAALLLYLIAAVTDNAVEMYGPLGMPLAALIALGLAASDKPSRTSPSHAPVLARLERRVDVRGPVG